jgi:plastocyanin
MRLGGLIGVLAFFAATSPAHASAVHNVNIGGNAFTPSELTITQGDVVNWNWVGPDKDHTTTTDASGQTTWDSDPTYTPGDVVGPRVPEGDRFSWNFPDPGEYSYFCKVHPNMTGKIIVIRKVNDPNGPPADVTGPKFGTPTVQVKKRRVEYTLDEDATVTVKLRGPTKRTKNVKAIAGQNVLKLPKRLKKGRYSLSMRAKDAAGNKSLVARLKFRVR